MTESVLLIEAIEAVARLTLNRPKAMNSLNLAILDELERSLDKIERDNALRVLVITGTGSAFCAGADLKEVLDGQALPAGQADFLDRANVVYDRLRNFTKPV